jgi:glycosyltransferase involved in cell wall biosynthesis
MVKKYQSKLTISYYYKDNSGQVILGIMAWKKAKGDYFIIFDSDCIIPQEYLSEVDNA